MGLFTRKKTRLYLSAAVADSLRDLPAEDGGESAAGDELVSVPDGSLDLLMDELIHDAAQLYPTLDMGEAVPAILAGGHLHITGTDLDALPKADQVAVQTIGRIGYASRIVETQRFASAEPAWELQEILRDQYGPPPHWWAVVSRIAASQAAHESLIPGPDEPGSLSWLLPGLGGQLRGSLASHWATMGLEQSGGVGLSHSDLMRLWKFGFFVRACEEVLPDGADLSS